MNLISDDVITKYFMLDNIMSSLPSNIIYYLFYYFLMLIIPANSLLFSLSTLPRWFDTADYFSKRGYSGLLLTLPDDGKMPNIDAAVDYFEGKR